MALLKLARFRVILHLAMEAFRTGTSPAVVRVVRRVGAVPVTTRLMFVEIKLPVTAV